MKSARKVARKLGRTLAAVAALLVVPGAAVAGLQDVGPANAGTGFPEWYRDTGQRPLELCLDQRASPNAEAAATPMCFPIVPDPAGYPGNLGSENFYFMAFASLVGAGGLNIAWEGALEATYATGTPIRGDEIVFARIRVVMDTAKAGTYKVVHPYGVEVFPNVPAGKRAVFYTSDVGVAPGVFTGALAGQVGPFLAWDQDPLTPGAPYGFDAVSGLPYSLQLANLDGTITSFVGDPSIFHTVTGSPFLTNYVRVEGPPGSNLDGFGNDFIVTNLFTTLGQIRSAPIAQPLEYCRATYGSELRFLDPANPVPTEVMTVDVFAEGMRQSKLLFTAQNIPTVELTIDDTTGYAYGHVEFPVRGPMPNQGTLTNLTDNPHSKVTGPVTDLVTSGPAVFTPAPGDPLKAGTLTVTAETSIHTVAAPQLSIVQLPGILGVVLDPLQPWIQTFTADIPLNEAPPWEITARSPLGGAHTEMVVLANVYVLAPPAPVAADVIALTTTGAAVTIPVDDPAWPAETAMLLNPPASGSASLLGNVFTYTPKPLFSGIDAFTYVLTLPDPLDPAKLVYSNAGVVTVKVSFVNAPPTAVADVATTSAGLPVTIDVAFNDFDADGTVVPASVAVAAAPLFGLALPNGDGTVTYTPNPGIVGVDTFTYTILDDLGAISLAATVTVNVFGQQEVLAFTGQYIISKARWRASGTSTVFGPGIANVVTVYMGCIVQDPAICPNPSPVTKVVGTAPIDPLGAWTVDVIDSTLKLDATGMMTAVSTGGGKAVSFVQVKN